MVAQPANQAFAALQPVAGRYAGRVARLWPAPYDRYLRLPAARRHLAHVVMPRIGAAAGLDARAFVRDIEGARARDILARWAPHAPAGLENALGKLPGASWTPAEYRRLVALLAQGGEEAAATLRHATVIDARLVETLDVLPRPMRGPAITRWVHNAWEARLVREAAALAERLGGDRTRVVGERLGRAKTRERFYDMLVEELRPSGLPAPVVETDLLRPLRTPAEIRDAGRRFRNCLASCMQRAVFGTSAFIEWRGAEPAVLELEHEGAAGWRLVVVLGFANRNVTAHTARLVRAALAEQGVRDGMSAQFVLAEINMIVEDERIHAEIAAQPPGEAPAQLVAAE